MGKRLVVFVGLVVLLGACASTGPRAEFNRQEVLDSASRYDVEIIRDEWGVPHIFGTTDADAAFGLAYAHAEDDFPTIQDALLTARGTTAAYQGKDAAAVDYMVQLLGVWDYVDAQYASDLRPETRAICEAYAAGLNYYAAENTDELISRDLLPFTGKDVVAGFVFRGPFFFGLDNAVRELFGSERRREVSTKTAGLKDTSLAKAMADASEWLTGGAELGSNTFAVSPKRTADGGTYLNINSHQPWEGPVTWWEAHVHSDEGWDAVGGVFPGAPVILHGHNRNLGWAHTVNRPDLVDIYVLETNPDDPNQYKFDGEWRDFEREEARIVVKLFGPFKIAVKREVLRSIHGPVVRAEHGVYAIRYAGMGGIQQVEQWYRMNKAETMAQWFDAMQMRANASLNTGFADSEGNIAYIYNALLPLRADGYDWQQYLPGDTSETLWTEYLPFDEMPLVINPASGFIQNCNSSPFQTTIGEGNPDPDAFPEKYGIERHMTNRALQANALFGADESITWEAFKAYKFDVAYHSESFVGRSVSAIVNAPTQEDPVTAEAVALLKNWDLRAAADSRGAALAILTLQPLYRGSDAELPETSALLAALKATAERLQTAHGRIDVPWSEVNLLKRGDVTHGLGGGPDTLRAITGRQSENGAEIIAYTGDSYILLVRWDAEGDLYSESVHQYGNATLDQSSPHYADQAPLFARHELKPLELDEADLRANAKRIYRPGE
jgi:acyl-homoserine-lactone acylase